VLEKIVVGYAGGPAGRDAVALAGTLAAATGGRLTVVFPYHPLLGKVDAQTVQREVTADVKGLLDTVAGATQIEEPTFRWSSSHWPIHALHELAGYEEADLIVVGAAKEGLGDHLHVSLMERLVHGAPCAVAVAPEGYLAERQRAANETTTIRRIGVGFASSSEGRAALELACELAARSGATVKMIAGAGLEPALASYAFSSLALGEVEEELYREIEEQLKRFCAEHHDGAPLERETIKGDPASVLIERSSKLDLLVLGSRAYGPLRHVLLGSVSARAMREARCPVLVVPRRVSCGDERDHEQRADVAYHG
jgi:nucleotide-binding universal stress UspA family protein